MLDYATIMGSFRTVSLSNYNLKTHVVNRFAIPAIQPP